jgi:hypothetical protein
LISALSAFAYRSALFLGMYMIEVKYFSGCSWSSWSCEV